MVPSPFSFRDFRLYWVARLTSTIAQMAMVVVVGWQVYDIARASGMGLSDAALQLGYVGLAQFIPLFSLTLVTGWTADRLDRRFIARATLALEIACALGLTWLTLSGSRSLPALFAVAGLLGVARAFAGPAFGALAPNLVPRQVLPRAIATSSIAWQAGTIAGPVAGGYLYDASPALPYAVSAVLFCVSLACLFLIRPVPRSAIPGNASPWAQMIDGIAYVRRNRLVLGAISLDLFAVLLGGATAMLPIYARDILHAGPQGVGALRAAPAVGSTLIAIWFSIRPLKNEVGAKMLFAVGIFGAATAAFGLSASMPVSLAALTILGAADMFSVFVRQSLIQLHTPDEMRGRVGAVSSLFISASNELGEARSGFLAAAIGARAAVVGGGIASIVVTAIWSRLFPELRLARSFDAPDMKANTEPSLAREFQE